GAVGTGLDVAVAGQRDIVHAEGPRVVAAAELQGEGAVDGVDVAGELEGERLRLGGERHLAGQHGGPRLLVELHVRPYRDRGVGAGGEGEPVRRAVGERDAVVAETGIPRVGGARGHLGAQFAAGGRYRHGGPPRLGAGVECAVDDVLDRKSDV